MIYLYLYIATILLSYVVYGIAVIPLWKVAKKNSTVKIPFFAYWNEIELMINPTPVAWISTILSSLIPIANVYWSIKDVKHMKQLALRLEEQKLRT